MDEWQDPRRDPWITELVPELKNTSTAELMRALKIGRSTAKRWKAGKAKPRGQTLEAVRRLVHARR